MLTCVFDFLSAGDILRLHDAMGPGVFCREHMEMFAKRINIKPRKFLTWERLKKHLSHRRCAECGVACRRHPLVCQKCASDPQNPMAMMSRDDIRHENISRLRAGHRAFGPCLLERKIRELPITKQTAVGTYMYWRRDVFEQIFKRRPKNFLYD